MFRHANDKHREIILSNYIYSTAWHLLYSLSPGVHRTDSEYAHNGRSSIPITGTMQGGETTTVQLNHALTRIQTQDKPSESK